MAGDALAERQVDSVRMVDVEAEGLRCGSLEREQLDVRFALGEPRFDRFLKVVQWLVSPRLCRKKGGPGPTSRKGSGCEKTVIEYSRGAWEPSSLGRGHLQHQRHRPVVYQLHRHPGAEGPALRPEAVAEALVERLGTLGGSGPHEAWSVALAGVGVERELADAEGLAIGERLVHATVGVVEDPQVPDPVGQPIRPGLGVVDANAQQHQKPGADRGDLRAIDRDRRPDDALDERPQ